MLRLQPARTALVALALAGACAGPGAELGGPRPASPSPAAAATRSSSLELPADPPGVRRVPFGAPSVEALAFSLRPTPGGRAVLAIADEGDRALVRRLTAEATPPTGAELRVVEGRWVGGAFDTSAGPVLATVDRAAPSAVCIEPWQGAGAAGARRCVTTRVAALVELGGDVVALEEHVIEPEAAPKPRTEPAPARPKPDATPPKRPKPPAQPGAKKPKKPGAGRPGLGSGGPKKKPPRRGPQAEPTPPPRPQRVEVWLRRFDGAEPEPTGLAFERPLAGMSLLDAGPIDGGVAVAWFEHVRGAGPDKQARLRAGKLDARGKLEPGATPTVFEGPRAWGYVEGHRDPRLVASGGRAFFLGRRVDKKQSGFEAAALFPLRALEVSATLAAIDPFRLAGGPLTTAEASALERIAAERPVLAPGGPANEAARVAWAGDRGYFLRDAALVVAARDGSTTALPHPFAVERTRLLGAALDPSGASLGLVGGDGLVALAADGATATTAAAPGLASELEAARVGEDWWLLVPDATGYALRRVGDGSGPATPSGTATLADLHLDAVALAGGAARGLLLAWRSGSAPELARHALEAGGVGPELARGAAP
ncbi:MAG: hypothetical protein HY908_20145, partial [Myxococcales bacterium]|nr:hypothetical protein [Myxococcales bacterium]